MHATSVKYSTSNASDQTITRVIEATGIEHWHAAQRSLLSEKSAQRRLIWRGEHRDWTIAQWIQIIFPEECSVERGAGKGAPWVWRYPSEKFDRDKVIEYNRSEGIRIMVWGGVWKSGRTDLVIMDHDEAIKRNDSSANSYFSILDAQLPLLQFDLTFQQDNSPIHTANEFKAWFCKYGVHRRWR